MKATDNALGIRHLRRLMSVAENHSVNAAAEILNKSPAAITKSIAEIERLLGLPLFDRSAKGMQLTVPGEILCRRARSAWQEYLAVRGALRKELGGKKSGGFLEISSKRLDSFLALHEHRNLKRAAKSLRLTPDALYKGIRELEQRSGVPLFDRASGSQVAPTVVSEVVAHHTKLARAEIRIALDEIASLDRTPQGRVTIGLMPRPRDVIVPRAINEVVTRYPQVHVTASEGPPLMFLERALRSGDLDFVVGAFRPLAAESGLTSDSLLSDKLLAVVRAGHPLLSENTALPTILERFGWVLPRSISAFRRSFDEALEESGLMQPKRFVETNSFSLAKGLLLEGDWIALSTTLEFFHERRSKDVLRSLPLHFSDRDHGDPHVGPEIYIVTRTHSTLSPAAELVAAHVRRAAKEIELEANATSKTMAPSDRLPGPLQPSTVQRP